jgi:transposase
MQFRRAGKAPSGGRRPIGKASLESVRGARRSHVCRQTVRRWMDEFRDSGWEALKKAGPAARKPELSEADRDRLKNLLLQGPEKLGMKLHCGPVRGWRT